MKVRHIIILFAAVITINGCKKENTLRQLDIKTLFTNTAWVGEFKYASRPVPEPFCIRFNKSGAFTWYEVDGVYTGTFTVNDIDKSVTATFSSGSTFTGTLSENKRLINLKYGGSYAWSILNVELNDDPAMQTLDGTAWKGESKLSPTLTARSVIVNFKAPGKIDYKEDPASSAPSAFSNYTYQFEYPVIKVVGLPYFGVIKNGMINGVYGTPASPAKYFNWNAKRQ